MTNTKPLSPVERIVIDAQADDSKTVAKAAHALAAMLLTLSDGEVNAAQKVLHGAASPSERSVIADYLMGNSRLMDRLSKAAEDIAVALERFSGEDAR